MTFSASDADRPEYPDVPEENTRRFERLLTAELRNELLKFIAKFAVVKSESKDIFQATLLQALVKLDDLQDESSFSGWLITIARNEVFGVLRKRKREKNHNPMYLEEHFSEQFATFDPTAPMERSENEQTTKTALQEALLSIPDDARFAFLAHFADGKSLRAVAEELKLTYDQVKKLVAKAKSLLSKRLQDMLIAYVVMDLYQGDTKSWADEVVQKLARMPVEASAATSAAATGASSIVGKGKFFLFSLASFVLLVFGCILSFLLGGLIVGKHLLRHAPTLRAKRWLVRTFLIWHMGLLAFPLVHLTIMLTLIVGFGFSDMFFRHYILFPKLILLLCGGASYLAWGVAAYWVQRKFPENDFIDGGYSALSRFVRIGLRICTIMIVVSYGIICWLIAAPNISFLLHPSSNPEKFGTIMMILTLITILLFGIHALYRLLFDKFLEMADDTSGLPKTTMPGMADTLGGTVREELILIAPFALIPAFYHLNHIINIHTRPVYSLLEVLFYTVWWSVVLRLNVADPSYRWPRILFSAVVHAFLFWFLRMTIYE